MFSGTLGRVRPLWGDTQRPLLVSARLGYEPSPDGQRPIPAAMNPCMQVEEVALLTRLVVLPCHAIVPGSGTALERQERFPQQVNIDVLQQRGELLLLPLLGSVPYTPCTADSALAFS